MRVLAYDPYLSVKSFINGGGEGGFEQLLSESDYISIHAPLNPETEKMFGLKEFRKMKPTAVILNTARGAIIDEQALYQALVEGVIAAPDWMSVNLSRLARTIHFSSWNRSDHRAFRLLFASSTLELQQKATAAAILALRGNGPRCSSTRR